MENKKGKPAYRPYEDAEVLDEATGQLRARDILEKYNEEIAGEQREQFQLEANGRFEGSHERALERMREEARQQQVSSTKSGCPGLLRDCLSLLLCLLIPYKTNLF